MTCKSINFVPSQRSLLLLGSALATFITPIALAQEGGQSSFAGAFFIARSADPNGVMHTEWFGSLLIWLLLALSVGGIGLMVSLALTNGRKAISPEDQIKRIKTLVKRGSWRDAMTLADSGGSDFDKIVLQALKEAPHGYEAMVHRTEQVAAEVITERLRRVEPLNILGQVAPMIGLFGTVYGMIVAFQSIVSSGGSADPVALAGGIGTALVTTFWGLLVAIPALAGYAFIRNRVDVLTSDAEEAALAMIKRFRTKPASSSSSTKRAKKKTDVDDDTDGTDEDGEDIDEA